MFHPFYCGPVRYDQTLIPVVTTCRAKEEMRRLIKKHPKGLADFEGDLTPTYTDKS
jgi:hypothetical protein